MSENQNILDQFKFDQEKKEIDELVSFRFENNN